ncbi:MAG: hypothetical protein CH6_4101 [Candidatus Kapaibacterium sp.]|nr:MAG: hypothetical protein CH6_4101 [Candidatus Kapabacteria bacterium]
MILFWKISSRSSPTQMKSKLFKPQPHEVIIPSFTITYTGGGQNFATKQ